MRQVFRKKIDGNSMVGNSKLELGDLPLVRSSLLEALQDVADYARSQTGEADIESAVHEFRKSLRRIRSMIRWIQDSSPEVDFRPLRNNLREVFQITNPLRDAHVIETIAESVRNLAEPGEFERLFPPRRPSEHPDARSRMMQASMRLETEVQRFEGLVPQDLSVDDLQKGTMILYRRCRRRRQTAMQLPKPKEIHDFRKRTKELRYVIEAVASVNTLAVPVEKDLGLLAKRLGRVTDLELLLEHLDPYTPWAIAVQETMSADFEEAVMLSENRFFSSPREFAFAHFLALRGRFGSE
jgi:CHAD domain-containing protein